MKTESPFFNPDLTKQMNRFSAVAEVRFTLLDKFNKDCRALTKMLEKFAVPELDWVYSEPEDSVGYYGLGWHDGTVVWACDDEMAAFGPSKAPPIYEAPAHVRSWLAEHNVLPLLFQDACLALEELSAKMANPKRLKPAKSLIDLSQVRDVSLASKIVEDLEALGYRILHSDSCQIDIGGKVITKELCDHLCKYKCVVSVGGGKIFLTSK